MWWKNLIKSCLCLVFVFDQVICLPYYYARDRNSAAKRSTRKISPALVPFGIKDDESAATKYMPESQDDESHFRSPQPRMMGLNTGNDAADHEAGIWLMALIGVLAAAVPVAFLNPSLGFKKKRSADQEDNFNNVLKALDRYGSKKDL